MVTGMAGPIEVRLPTPESPVPLAGLGVLEEMPVLAVAGSTAEIEPDLAARLLPLLGAAVAVAAEHDVAVVTGGTDAGVFRLLGLALSAAPRRPAFVVGVAPDALVTGTASEPGEGEARIDPCLDVLVRVPGEAWGDETPALSRVVGEIAGHHPAVMLLVGGGPVSRGELVEHLSQGRAVVVLANSGRLADELTTGLPTDSATDLAALLATGDVRFTSSDDDPGALRAVLDERLRRPDRPSPPAQRALLSVLPRFRFLPSPPESLLSPDAARRYPLLRQRLEDADRIVYPAFAASDVEAQREQNRYRRFTLFAILGGLLTTAFGAIQTGLPSAAWPGVVVATLGAATSVVTSVARRHGTLNNYLTSRIRAERLRSLFFDYLANRPTTDPATHEAQVLALEVRVAELVAGPQIP